MNKPEREGFVENEAFEIDAVDPRPRPARPRSVEQVRSAPKIVEPEREPEPAPEPKPEEAEAKAPQAEPEKWPLVITLRHRDLKGPEGLITELVLQEPTAGDIARAGGN